MGKALAICSGKGGTGKTSCAAALSACLAERGRLVLVIDCDIGLRNLDLVLGVSEDALFDLSDVTENRMPLENAVCSHPLVDDLHILPAPSLKSAADISPDSLAALVAHAKEKYDYVIMDAPAGIGTGFKLVTDCADEIIMVANPDSSSLRDAERAASELADTPAKKCWLLINRLRRSFLRASKRNIDRMIDEVGLQLIGVVREDRDVSLSGDGGIPLRLMREPLRRSAARQFARIAARLDGEDILLGPI